MSDAVVVDHSCVIWESAHRVTIQLKIASELVNGCFLIAYSYRPKLGIEPESMPRKAAHTMHQLLWDFDYPIVNMTKEFWQPALITCDVGSRRQLRLVDYELQRRLFRPVAWFAYANEAQLHYAKMRLLTYAENALSELLQQHLPQHVIRRNHQSTIFTQASYDSKDSFRQRVRMLYKLGYSESKASPARTVTRVHLCATTTFDVANSTK